MKDKNPDAQTEVPSHGCVEDRKKMKVENVERALNNLWSLGGDKRWYYANRLWRFRGFLDKLAGGVGLRRGKTHPTEVHHGDVLDF